MRRGLGSQGSQIFSNLAGGQDGIHESGVDSGLRHIEIVGVRLGQGRPTRFSDGSQGAAAVVAHSGNDNSDAAGGAHSGEGIKEYGDESRPALTSSLSSSKLFC